MIDGRSRLGAGRSRLLVLAAAVGLLGGSLAAANPTPTVANHVAFSSALNIPPELTGSDITLTAQTAAIPILPGPATTMWTYNGIFPGPTIRVPTGQTTRVTLVNQLPSAAGSLTLHNHGNHSSPENDGQPDAFLVQQGGSYTYTYTGLEAGGNERGALQWYHDHRMDVTGRNVWMGLAGMYIIDDPADPGTLPSGAFDVPLMLTDRSFDANNQLAYRFDLTGVTGDHILVNGVPQPFFAVGDRRYRLRILNASNYRSYDLAMSNGQPLVQIGTESGLLPAPVSRSHILIGPAERVEVVVDFAGLLGQNVVLRNLAAQGALGELMEFRVTQDLVDDSQIPTTLRALPALGTPTTTRSFDFGRKNGRWTINGRFFEPERIDARPVLGSTETWILANSGGWDHLIHIHDVDQQLVSRNGSPPTPDELMKETWNISGGQTVEVKLKFTDNVGRYVFHCHILEHEDAAMMAQFEVVAPASSTGARSPSAEAAAAGGDGNGFETNPTAAFADGADFASNTNGAGDRHLFSGYGLALPAGATIDGIGVRLDWWLDSIQGRNWMDVELSWDGGTTWTGARRDAAETTTEHSGSLGGSADTWGRTWTPAELSDATFRVRLTSGSNSAARDFYLDWVPVTIWYH
ncbi:MAG TPA: multicopper oxidase family protein [Candidatus Limnocylindrales bacterium]|nr:multicopper oxidase family protein [Candidatus Limnocylindrales bacterium]